MSRLLLAAMSLLLLVGGLLTVTGSAPMMRSILASVSLARDAPPSTVAGQVPRAAPELVIEGYAFTPDEMSAPAGTAVTVVNRDQTVQIVAAMDGSFGSGEIPAGGTGTFMTPATPGTYPYRSGVLPFMTGTLTVT